MQLLLPNCTQIHTYYRNHRVETYTTVTYASISQHNSQANNNGVPHCDLSLALDDRVDYIEVRLQSGTNDHIKSGKNINKIIVE